MTDTRARWLGVAAAVWVLGCVAIARWAVGLPWTVCIGMGCAAVWLILLFLQVVFVREISRMARRRP